MFQYFLPPSRAQSQTQIKYRENSLSMLSFPRHKPGIREHPTEQLEWARLPSPPCRGGGERLTKPQHSSRTSLAMPDPAAPIACLIKIGCALLLLCLLCRGISSALKPQQGILKTFMNPGYQRARSSGTLFLWGLQQCCHTAFTQRIAVVFPQTLCCQRCLVHLCVFSRGSVRCFHVGQTCFPCGCATCRAAVGCPSAEEGRMCKVTSWATSDSSYIMFVLTIYLFFYLFISSSEGAKVIFLSCTSHSGGDWNIHDNAIVLELKQFCLSSHKPGLWLLL